jgi:hypothetical protein
VASVYSDLDTVCKFHVISHAIDEAIAGQAPSVDVPSASLTLVKLQGQAKHHLVVPLPLMILCFSPTDMPRTPD